jgi:predicted DNA-binding transcriptional regulator YafY
MAYDSNIDYTGYDKIQPIFNAIVNKRVLEIEYKPYNKPAFTLAFHPYYLKQYNNRWFVFGLNQLLQIPTWNLALDRINSISESTETYLESQIDWEDHFYDIIGVSTPENGIPEKVELIFSADQASYIKTKPLHPSQKAHLIENDELLVVLNLIPNYELEMTLLSFGEKVKIVSPLSLKSKLKQRLNDAGKQYY